MSLLCLLVRRTQTSGPTKADCEKPTTHPAAPAPPSSVLLEHAHAPLPGAPTRPHGLQTSASYHVVSHCPTSNGAQKAGKFVQSIQGFELNGEWQKMKLGKTEEEWSLDERISSVLELRHKWTNTRFASFLLRITIIIHSSHNKIINNNSWDNYSGIPIQRDIWKTH